MEDLRVKGRAPKIGYSRDMYGLAWLDADGNGCDTRNDILQAYLEDAVIADDGCVVKRGMLDDPYTGDLIRFVRGDGDLVDIDHVVALGDSWVKGAARWGMRKRAAFANDPLNLLPVDSGANRQKGDGDAATWLPPQKSFRCEYVARQIAVKAKYDLWVTKPEKRAMKDVLATCPAQDLPDDTTDAPVQVPFAVASPSPSPKPSPAPVPDTPEYIYYANCDAVRAAGAAPLYAGEPGYDSHLDRDGDGVACET